MFNETLLKAVFGRLSWESFPIHEPILLVTFVVVVALGLGIDVNTANNAGNTALHGAAMAGFNTIVQLLVDRGATVNAENTRGETPLKLAAEGFVRGGQLNVRPKTAALLRTLGGVLQ